MNIEIGLLIVFVLLIVYTLYQKKQERFVPETGYSTLKTDIEKTNTIKSFFQKLTFEDDKYYLDGVEIKCNVNGTNNTDEDTVV